MILNNYGIWTDNPTIFTIEFNKFWTDEEIKPIIYNGDFKTLFPENIESLTDDIKREIQEHFYYRQIAEETPQKFLRHFHQIIRTSSGRWYKLLQSENALRPDDAIYNYDMTEEQHVSGNNNTQYETDGTAQAGNNTVGYISDTPDGAVSDIENYMSNANKTNITSDSTDHNEGSSTNNMTSVSTLTRKGNIGVMTSAQIIGGYRDATAWSAYNVIFKDLENLFLGVF